MTLELEGQSVLRISAVKCHSSRVDSNLRLPNMHLCPPAYQSESWTSVASVHERTRSVLDMKGLCAAFTYEASFRPYVLNTRVCMCVCNYVSCMYTKTRQKTNQFSSFHSYTHLASVARITVDVTIYVHSAICRATFSKIQPFVTECMFCGRFNNLKDVPI